MFVDANSELDRRVQIVRKADWYFDFISPYAYLQFHQLSRLPEDVELRLRPTLFAGLLNYWGQLGPAEIPEKKRHTFQLCRWRADRLNMPFKAPPRHPFNPLPTLRLAIATGATRESVGTIFDFLWAEGKDAQDADSLKILAERLGVHDLNAATSEEAVKIALRTNTEEACAAGVYGVPSFVIDGLTFWGDDMMEMMLEWLEDPNTLGDPESLRIANLPAAAVRPRPSSPIGNK
jgi:2-hydroxychromene-2-carboxylate isomerase